MLPDNFDQSLRSFHPIDKGVCKFSLIHLLVRDGNNAAARTILSKSFRKELPRAPRHRVTHEKCTAIPASDFGQSVLMSEASYDLEAFILQHCVSQPQQFWITVY